MNKFFKIFFFILIFISIPGIVRSETAKEIDPATPAPESPVQLRIPHSQRTKDNVLDSVVDFILTRYFRLFEDKHVDISYKFFEIDQNYDLNFTDFTVNISLPTLQGKAVVPKLKLNLDEFLAFIKGKKLMISKAELNDLSADMTLIETKDGSEKKRVLKSSAKKIIMTDILLSVLKDQQSKTQDATFGSVKVDEASLSLSNPKEKYAVSDAEMKDIVLPNGLISKVSFSSVKVGEKIYTDQKTFLQAIKQ